MITDAYSKKIVGYELSDNLQTASTLKALKQALKNRVYKHSLIHHSDRGLQYCSKEYTETLRKNDILISMTENSDPYENAVAERVNGILKYEFGLIDTFENFKNLSQQLDQSIYYYNNLRPHFRVSVPVWGITLSGPLKIVDLVSRYLTNYLILRVPISIHRSFQYQMMPFSILWGINLPFERLSPR